MKKKLLVILFFFLFFTGSLLSYYLYARSRVLPAEEALMKVIKNCKTENYQMTTKEYIAYLLSAVKEKYDPVSVLPPEGYDDYLTYLLPEIYCRLVWYGQKGKDVGFLVYEDNKNMVIKIKSENFPSSLLTEDSLLELVKKSKQ